MENNQEKKQTVLSLIQPTGTPTLGNYLGALKNWKNMSDGYDCFFGVADLHSITVRPNPADLRRRTTEMYALLLALGLDPHKNTVFVQSHVPAHAQLAWILDCYTQFGEASRMTQFKDKSEKHPDNVNVGLFAYPVQGGILAPDGGDRPVYRRSLLYRIAGHEPRQEDARTGKHQQKTARGIGFHRRKTVRHHSQERGARRRFETKDRKEPSREGFSETDQRTQKRRNQETMRKRDAKFCVP